VEQQQCWRVLRPGLAVEDVQVADLHGLVEHRHGFHAVAANSDSAQVNLVVQIMIGSPSKWRPNTKISCVRRDYAAPQDRSVIL
jgi:hypothetical protein